MVRFRRKTCPGMLSREKALSGLFGGEPLGRRVWGQRPGQPGGSPSPPTRRHRLRPAVATHAARTLRCAPSPGRVAVPRFGGRYGHAGHSEWNGPNGAVRTGRPEWAGPRGPRAVRKEGMVELVLKA